MSTNPSRRELLASASAALTIGFTSPSPSVHGFEESKQIDPFTYCLNTSTLRGQKLTLVQEVEIAARAGYTAIEPWIRELEQHVEMGKSLKDLGKQIRDLGLAVPSSIGFAQWIVDDETQRKKGLEEARRAMDLVSQIGGTRLAAPPTGATKQTDLNLFHAADRYRKLLEIGDQMGIVAEVEVWGFSKSLSRLGETVFVAVESGHPKACILPDVYHIYKGGSSLEGLKLLNGAAMPVFHMNDYPATPSRAEISDADRVYPGDGVAPLTTLIRDLHSGGFRGVLSLELFNREYWKQDPGMVARTGLEKMKAVTKKSLQGSSKP